MNSLYGRLGMHTEAIHNAIVSPEQATEIAKSHKVHNIIPIGGLELISYSLDLPISDVRVKPTLRAVIRELPGQTNVPIAAAVTAYSRIIINNLKLSAMAAGLEIYYSDTDSLVINGQMPQEFCDSAELGKLKLEHKIMEGYFVAPKMYYLVLEDGTTVAKCKGYLEKLNKDQYLSLLEGKDLDLK